ncbi:hypothetical protein, partial [Paracoccus fontiphilus]
MLLRDLLVALPGLIASPGSLTRTDDITFDKLQGQTSFQIVSPVLTVSDTGAIALLPFLDPTANFFRNALTDFFQQIGFQPPEAPDFGTVAPPPLPLRTDNLGAEAGRVVSIGLDDSGPVESVRI